MRAGITLVEGSNGIPPLHTKMPPAWSGQFHTRGGLQADTDCLLINSRHMILVAELLCLPWLVLEFS